MTINVKQFILGLNNNGGSGVVATSTWNPVDTAAGISFSNGNNTATSSTTSNACCRGTLGHLTGKYHVEFTITGVSQAGIAIASSIFTLTNVPGAAGNTSVLLTNGTSAMFNNGIIGTIDAYTVGNTVAVEVDVTNNTISVNKLGGTGWKGPFAVAGLNGASVFPLFYNYDVSGSSIILNTGGSAFQITPQSGYSAWG